MDVKEAIEKVKDKYEGWMGYAMSQKVFNELEKERNEVIYLLQQLKKYRQIFEYVIARINNVVNYRKLGWATNLDTPENFKQLLEELEQKYFPKEAKQDYPEGDE